MTNSSLRFKIAQLRQDKLIYAVESIAVFIFSLFVSIFLPQLLFRYLYANQQLLEEPMLLQYIPVFSFAVGVGYFLFAMTMNISKMMQINKLQKELEQKMATNNCSDCSSDFSDCCDSGEDAELEEMQHIVDQVLAEAEKSKKKSKKTSVKKSASKSKSKLKKK